MLVTGDIAEAARPSEYETALIFFGTLVEKLRMARSAVVFVPGNHDVSWTQCQSVEGQLQDELFPATELRGRLDAVKLTRFNDMVARFYDPSLPRHTDTGPGPARPVTAGDVTALPRGAYVHDFSNLAVSVAALDSCEVESHRDADHRGYIGNDQAQAVLTHWSNGAPADRIRIVAVHHNPVPTIPPAIREWRGWLRSKVKRDKLDAALFEHFAADAVGFEGHERLQAIAADAQVSLLFHGHHHASDAVHAWGWRGKRASGDTRVISAGSWSLIAKKLPAEQPVVMQLVRVDPTTATVRPVLLRYEPRARTEGVVEPGAFIGDEVTRDHAPLALSLPTALRATKRRKGRDTPPAAARTPRASAMAAAASLIAAYRVRKQDAFVRWDLRAVGASPRVGNHRPVEVNLDDMYIPLRFGENSAWCLARDFEQYLGRDSPLYWTMHFQPCTIQDFKPDYKLSVERALRQLQKGDFRQHWNQYFGRQFVQDFGWEFERQLAAAWNMETDVAAMPLWEDFALVEAASALGRASVRTAVAYRELPNDERSELRLFRWACRVSLGRKSHYRQLTNALKRYKGDPLWPALARHIARMSTSNDRALLEDLAARPEQRDAPVSWALRYYVRGDIVTRDGAVITMDEICDDLGLERLPLLEDMAPEIEIDWSGSRGDGEDARPTSAD